MRPTRQVVFGAIAVAGVLAFGHGAADGATAGGAHLQVSPPIVSGPFVVGRAELHALFGNTRGSLAVGLYRAAPGARYGRLVAQRTAYITRPYQSVYRFPRSACIAQPSASSWFVAAIARARRGKAPVRTLRERSVSVKLWCGATS